MDCFVDFRPSLSRQLRIPAIYAMALLVFVLLADLQCSDCILGSAHRATATALRPPFHRASWRPEAVAAAGNRGLPQSGRGLPATRVRSVQSIGVSAASNGTKAPPATEVQALAAFKAAITDRSGALRSWTVGPAAGAGNDSGACSGWAGITCSPQSPNHVVGLNLSDLELVGSLDSALPTLTHLPFLQILDLSVNFFGGFIQGESLTNLSHLSYFNVSSNFITGEIPSEMGNQLVSLQVLDVSLNNMTGPIPESLGNCSSLRSIYVGQNSLNGGIPDSFGRLSSLEYLNVSFNSLSGSVPAAIGNCSSLRLLDLTNNFYIGGPFPPEMSQLKRLQRLYAQEVYISGAFPRWIANLTSLARLSLFENDIDGEVPESIGQLQFLEDFSVCNNQMTGIVPLSFYNVTSLQILQLCGTLVSGHIPPEIGKLPNLYALNLANNLHTGIIPSSIANLSNLWFLELGTNELMDPEPFPPWIGSLTLLSTIFLSQMNLQGEIPKSISQLSSLTFLAAAINNLTGGIPVGLRNCTYLQSVDIGQNRLIGEFPPELGELSDIAIFYVFNNDLTGSFPEFITNWTQLAHIGMENNLLSGLLDDQLPKIDQLPQLFAFDVGGNDFEGPIPEIIGNCTGLNQLFMDDNRFTGLTPPWFGNLTLLQELNLSYNSLRGPIPGNFFGSGSQLAFLDLNSNEFEGSIPVEIGRLGQLTELYLSNNKLTGIVPSSMGNCSKMSHLDLAGNKLEGSIPGTTIAQMSASLSTLNLSRNLFSGPWPREFAKLTVLQILNVSFNNLSGSVPLGLGQCVNLNSLDISINNLTGEIPKDLGSLTNLQFFNASFNYFTGPIPQSGIFNSTRINASSFLGNPGLCGSRASIGQDHQPCAAVQLNVSSHDHHCKGFSCKHVWIPVGTVSAAIVLGAVTIVLGIIIGRTLFRRGKKAHAEEQLLLNFGAHMKFTEKDVLRTINDPRGDNVIGRGGRSIVYLGILPGGQKFALKKLLPSSESQGDTGDASSASAEYRVLVNEAKILAHLRHNNILKYLSFYSDADHKVLIVDYMSGGSLHHHLHEVEPSQLTWQTRLKIALGVAQGMKYLHHDLSEPLIHRDLKPANVFLNEDLEPKVGDFGISKFVGAKGDGEATASTFCGTVGYMPPEYGSQLRVSTKGDVFSYGMLVIELLTRRQPCSTHALDDQGTDLRNWVLADFHERPFELLDPSLVQECSLDKVAKQQMVYLLRVSLFCTRAEPQSRPSMMNVVGMIMYIVNLGVEPTTRRTIEELANLDLDPSTWVLQDPAVEGSEFGSNC